MVSCYQTIVDLLISSNGTIVGCPHAGFANPFASPHTRPRESIESRVLVFYTTLKPFPPKIGNPLQNGA